MPTKRGTRGHFGTLGGFRSDPKCLHEYDKGSEAEETETARGPRVQGKGTYHFIFPVVLRGHQRLS